MNCSRLLLAALLVLLAGCGAQGPAGTAGGSPVAPATAAANTLPATVEPVASAAAPTGEAPTSVAPPTAPAASPTADLDAAATLTAELSATVTAQITPVPTSASGMGSIEGASALTLTGDPPLWVAYSHGSRSYEPEQRHFIALYARQSGVWSELGRVGLENADYIDPAGVQQAYISSDRRWIEVLSGTGAHSGCYDLLSFDGTSLRSELSHCYESPNAGFLQDVNGDSTPDVVLNNTANYIFCYACGVKLASFDVRRWDGQVFAPVELTPLPESAPAELRELNNRAVALAQAGLWKDAQAAISATLALNADDPTYRWNAGLVRLTAGARQALTVESAYPLLAHMFYGDYPAALDVMRRHSPEQLFGRVGNPLVLGTTAEGFEESLIDSIIETTNLALGYQSDLAAGYFLRGWALHLRGGNDSAALSDIERAAEFDRQEALYQQSVAFLKK